MKKFPLTIENVKNHAYAGVFVNRLNKEKSLANPEKRLKMLTFIAEHNLMLAVRIVNSCFLTQKAETQIVWEFYEKQLLNEFVLNEFEQSEWKKFVDNFAVPNGVREYQVGDAVVIKQREDGFIYAKRIVVSKDEENDKVTLSNGDVLDATNLTDATYGRNSDIYCYATDALLAEFEHNLAVVRQNNPLNQAK